MSKSSFLRLVDFLSPNSVFVPKGRGRPPAAARIQIAAFLLRVGSLGTYASSALQACISEGSIYAYCNNVVKALLDRLKDVVQMPSLERRAEIAEDIGLPGCVGAIDGSLIPLENAPSQHASSYYNGRLKRHCVRTFSLYCMIRSLTVVLSFSAQSSSRRRFRSQYHQFRVWCSRLEP